MLRRGTALAAASLLLAISVLMIPSVGPARAVGLYLYGARSTGVSRVAIAGPTVTNGFVTGATAAMDVATDGTYLYFGASGGSSVGRANLDGTGLNASFVITGGLISGVTVSGSYIYWISNPGGAWWIGRANLDGTGVNLRYIAVTIAAQSGGIAADASYIYWTNYSAGAGTTIGRANIDGTGANDSWMSGLTNPTRLAVTASYIYWTSATGSAIGRANLDGTSTNGSFITGLSSPWGIATDGSYLYWDDTLTTAIGRANMDGTGPSTTWATGLTGAGRGITVGGTAAPSAPVVTTDPTDQSVVAGATATFTAAATGTPTPTVKWQVSTDGGLNFTDIPGATSTTLSFTTALADSGNKYRAVFTNGVPPDATTTAATLTVSAAPSAPVVTTDPTDQSVVAGATATFTAAATGTPTPTVKWQVSTDGGLNFTDVPGATSTTLSFTAALGQDGYKYRAVFTNGVPPDATTTAATLTVSPTPVAPVVTTDPTDQSVLAGATATFTAAATGTPTPTVKWQVSTDGGLNFTDVPGATSTTLSFTAALGQNGNKYRAVFTNGVLPDATTAAANLTVNAVPSAPVVTLNPANRSVVAGATATFTAAATGNPTPTAQWQVSTNGGALFTDIPGATSTTLSFTAALAQSGYQYRAVFTNGLPPDATTTAATLTVAPVTNPVPTIATFSPLSGRVGSTVTILGTNFSTASAVYFNGVRATFSVRSPSAIVTTVPVGAMTGPITVVTRYGSVTSALKFYVFYAR